MKKKIEGLKDLIKIQGQKGNWNASEYMTGLYNGLVLALSVFTGKEPKYKTRNDGHKKKAKKDRRIDENK